MQLSRSAPNFPEGVDRLHHWKLNMEQRGQAKRRNVVYKFWSPNLKYFCTYILILIKFTSIPICTKNCMQCIISGNDSKDFKFSNEW